MLKSNENKPTGKEIKELRKELGLTMQELADLSGTVKSTVCKIESEKYSYNIAGSKAIVKLYNSLVEYRSKNTGPKILFYDIEIAPMRTYMYQLWQKLTSIDAIESDFYILTIAYKFLGEEMKVLKLNDYTDEAENDSYMLEDFKKIMDSADYVCGWNSKKFDDKKINTRLIINGFGPVTPYRNIDLMLECKANFGFTSNKMDFVANKLLGRNKLKTDMNLWIDCMAMKEDAFNEMAKYNIVDVEILEELYFKIMPFSKKNYGFTSFFEHDKRRCPTCCSTNVYRTDKFAVTSSSKFSLFECGDCGSYSRDKGNVLTKEKRAKLLMNNV